MSSWPVPWWRKTSSIFIIILTHQIWNWAADNDESFGPKHVQTELDLTPRLCIFFVIDISMINPNNHPTHQIWNWAIDIFMHCHRQRPWAFSSERLPWPVRVKHTKSLPPLQHHHCSFLVQLLPTTIVVVSFFLRDIAMTRWYKGHFPPPPPPPLPPHCCYIHVLL